MQKYTTVGLALLITMLAICVFGYCAFIGLNYGLSGRFVLSFLITMLAFAVLVYSIYKLIISKATRNAREGKPREILAAVAVFVILLAGSVPFTKFIEVYNNKELLNEAVKNTIAAVGTIDSTYVDYAEARIKKVKKTYRKSLRRRLLPENIERYAEERQQWLSDIHEVNIWNIYTATNAYHLMEAAENWAKEYHDVSSVFYEGEECEPFQHEVSEEQVKSFKEVFRDFHLPSLYSILATVFCFLCMLACYYATIRPTSKN